MCGLELKPFQLQMAKRNTRTPRRMGAAAAAKKMRNVESLSTHKVFGRHSNHRDLKHSTVLGVIKYQWKIVWELSGFGFELEVARSNENQSEPSDAKLWENGHARSLLWHDDTTMERERVTGLHSNGCVEKFWKLKRKQTNNLFARIYSGSYLSMYNNSSTRKWYEIIWNQKRKWFNE